ncbi:MAG TPA: GatB/YqeY domain-containing protein [Thermodesulfobacteriota bacterium]|nr:GatB/YqeY domain-containing protein [Thermodesulfobacteriota bacterium]
MSLKDKLTDEMKDAMRSQDKVRLSTIRMLLSAVKNKEIDLREKLTDEEVIETITSQVKQRRDSIEQFTNAGRLDLVEKEEAELKILQGFLPKQLTPEEIDSEVEKAVGEAEASGMKDLGKVMKLLMPRVAGRADGKLVIEKVRERLSK